MRLNTEQLMGLAEVTWNFARRFLKRQGKFLPQITLVDVDGGGLSVGQAPDCPIPPYDIVRLMLEQKPSSAFIFIAEAWSIKMPQEVAVDGLEAVRGWCRTLPQLEYLASEDRGESLMMIAVGHDFSLERIVSFWRVDGTIIFDKERPRSNYGEGYNRFFNLRNLLVRAEGNPNG